MTHGDVLEVDGELVLPLAGLVCSEVRSSWAKVVLIVRSEDSQKMAEIGGLDEVAAAELVVRKARVARAISTTDSVLRIEFDGGDSIEIPSRPDVEAWEVRLRDDETGTALTALVVCVPGGEYHAYWNF